MPNSNKRWEEIDELCLKIARLADKGNGTQVAGNLIELQAIFKEILSQVENETVKRVQAGLIKKFEELKDKAPSLRDMLYLDGVMAVIETFDASLISPKSE